MIPPLFLEVKDSDLVLDMCAAPGSKTTQILEFMQKGNEELVGGGVLANEVDFKRAWILSHQVKKLKVPNIAIINHPGQFIPNLINNNQKVLYDKILVDTPCSGDGAIRKLPERWHTFSPMDGNNIHPLQVQLLTRAIRLLKEGGVCVYSTCSLNAVENEAVITEVFKTFNESGKTIQLESVHESLNGFKMRPGLSNWCLMAYKKDRGESGEVYEKFWNWDQSQEHFKEEQKMRSKFLKSMFPLSKPEMDLIGIEKTARILPHDNNSGGFFVAKIRKLKMTENDCEETENVKISRNNKKTSGLYVTEEYEQIKDELILSLKKEFKLREDFPFHQLVSHVKSSKKISLVSKQIHDFFALDPQKKINQIYSGTCVFNQNKKKPGLQTWRISNDGVRFLRPYLLSNLLKVSKKLFLFLI